MVSVTFLLKECFIYIHFFAELHSFKEYLGLNKARIYNLQHRKKPAELVRKDLISAMKMADHENLTREHYLRILDSWREEWEKGVQVPVNPDSLPKPKVSSIDKGVSLRQNTLEKALLLPLDDQLQKDSFKLPKNLIKVFHFSFMFVLLLFIQ